MAATTDEDLGTALILIGLAIPIYAFSVGAVAKLSIMLSRCEKQASMQIWVASAVILCAIPGYLLGFEF